MSRIDELQRLHEAATKGWKPGVYSNTIDCDKDRAIVSEWIGGCGFWDEEDRDVAIAARNALPALLRVARAARDYTDWMDAAKFSSMRDAVAELESPADRIG